MCDNRTQAQMDEAEARGALRDTRQLWNRYLAQSLQMLALMGDRHKAPANEAMLIESVTRLMGEQYVTLALLLGIPGEEKT
jgi:hypothetical protein